MQESPPAILNLLVGFPVIKMSRILAHFVKLFPSFFLRASL
jgi:hypothetical protein